MALLALVRVPLAAQSGADVARAFREANEVSILRDFTELLSYPNRARDTEDIRRTAAYIRDELRAVGTRSAKASIREIRTGIYSNSSVILERRDVGRGDS